MAAYFDRNAHEESLRQYRRLLEDNKRRAAMKANLSIQIERSLRQIAESHELLSRIDRYFKPQ
jgi:hypothetical protein